MNSNWGPSRFGVKFWLASAAIISILMLADTAIITAHARSQHVHFWILSAVDRFGAIALTWGAWFGGYQRIRTSAAESGASPDVLLSIEFWSAQTLLMMCVAIEMLVAASSH